MAQANNSLKATPQETYNEIARILENNACGGKGVQVAYEHPYLSVENNCDYHQEVVKLNVTLITDASPIGNSDSMSVTVKCSNTCLYYWRSGDGKKLDRKAPESNYYLFSSLPLDPQDARRVANALKHFGELYDASNPSKKDKFD